MLLSARFLNDCQSANSFRYASALEIYAGDGQTLFFQLVDMSLDRADEGYFPAGRRYMPPAGTGLVVTLMNVDDAKVVTRTATQPFAGDASIWSIPILSTDPLKGTVNWKAVLSEPTPRTLNFTSVPGVLLRVR